MSAEVITTIQQALHLNDGGYDLSIFRLDECGRSASRSHLQQLECFGRNASSTTGANEKLGSQEKRFDFVFKRVGTDAHGVADGFDPGWTAVENADHRFQIASVLSIKSDFVDPSHEQSLLRNRRSILPLALL